MLLALLVLAAFVTAAVLVPLPTGSSQTDLAQPRSIPSGIDSSQWGPNRDAVVRFLESLSEMRPGRWRAFLAGSWYERSLAISIFLRRKRARAGAALERAIRQRPEAVTEATGTARRLLMTDSAARTSLLPAAPTFFNDFSSVRARTDIEIATAALVVRDLLPPDVFEVFWKPFERVAVRIN